MIQLCLAWAAAPRLDISLGSLNGKRKWKQFSAQFNSNYAVRLETGDTMRTVRNAAQTSISVPAKLNLTNQTHKQTENSFWGKHVSKDIVHTKTNILFQLFCKESNYTTTQGVCISSSQMFCFPSFSGNNPCYCRV